MALSIPPGSLRRKKYRAIFLDAGNTLLQPYPSVGALYAEAAAAYGFVREPAAVEKIFKEEWNQRSREHSLAAASSGKAERAWWHALVKSVFHRLGEFPRFEEYFSHLYELFATGKAWRLFPDALEVLEECGRRGVILGIVSNWDSRLPDICRELGLAPCLRFILYSAQAGVSKPDSKIFRLALQRAGVEAGEALHVGDSWEDDVLGARQAGLDALWLRRDGGRPSPRVATADSLRALLKLC